MKTPVGDWETQEGECCIHTPVKWRREGKKRRKELVWWQSHNLSALFERGKKKFRLILVKESSISTGVIWAKVYSRKKVKMAILQYIKMAIIYMATSGSLAMVSSSIAFLHSCSLCNLLCFLTLFHSDLTRKKAAT